MSQKEQIKEIIMDARGTKANSANLYAMNIIRVAKLVDADPLSKTFPKREIQKINKILDEAKPIARKNMLQALVVYMRSRKDDDDDIDKFSEKLKIINKEIDQQNSLQKKTSKQQKNWATIKELRGVLRLYEKELRDEKVFQSSGTLPKKLMEKLKYYVTGMLYLSGDDNPPRRLEYGNMRVIKKAAYEKLSAKEKEDNNYLVIQGRNKKIFHLGNYKTSNTYGSLQIPVGKPLNKVLNVWLRFHDGDYLLSNGSDNPLTGSQMTKLLYQVFQPIGKQISASMLRHIYLSEKFPAQNIEKAETAMLMSHSVEEANNYSKL
jgi:hypothetical protein